MVICKYYYINHVPVQIRHLPSGDIAVWHPFNAEIAEIVSGFCRGYGYWDSNYNNWVIFAGFKHTVICLIERRSAKHGQ